MVSVEARGDLRGHLSSPPGRAGFPWFLLAILLLAIVVRLYWVQTEVRVLQGEEPEYTRLAENLLKRHAYVGLFEGPQLMYPPLLPALVAAGSFLTGDWETAGHPVTFVAGVALVLAVFALAQLLYGSRVALIAAALTACHPILIDLSGAVYSESVYLPLTIGGFYFGLRCVDCGGKVSATLCGVCLGLAYLARPEALFHPWVITAALLGASYLRGTSTKRTLVVAACVMITFVALATPYVAYLSFHAGGLRLEGKSPMNFAIGQRRQAGMNYLEATLGIGPDLREEGPHLSPTTFLAEAPYPVPLHTVVEYWMASARRNKTALYEAFVLSPAFGSLLGFGLATIALLRRPWSQRRLIFEGTLLTIFLGHLVIVLGQHAIQFRFLLPLLPLLLIWESKGIDEVARWVVASARHASRHTLGVTGRLGVGTRFALGSLLVLMAVRALAWGTFKDASARELDLKDAGIWLAQYRPGPKRIMGEDEVIFYAGGTKYNFPYADSGLALQYVRHKEPDFIVLTERLGPSAPYHRDWFDHGIPDPAARLIFRTVDHQVTIYEWIEGRRSEESVISR
jgi:4-amino-4-deoxy-L-arabinose transferase-like glycosyltransferase